MGWYIHDGRCWTPLLYNSFSGEKPPFSRRKSPGNSRATVIRSLMSRNWSPLSFEGWKEKGVSSHSKCVNSKGGSPPLSLFLCKISWREEGINSAKFRTLRAHRFWQLIFSWVPQFNLVRGDEGAMKRKGCWRN